MAIQGKRGEFAWAGYSSLLLLSYQHQHSEFEVHLEVECAFRISLTQLKYNGASSPVADLWTFAFG